VSQTFVFRVRRTDGGGIQQEGLSPRYTAITLLGMAHLGADDRRAILGDVRGEDVFARLVASVTAGDNLGDVALALWASHEHGVADLGSLTTRLEQLQPAEREHPVVELAWTLSALADARIERLDALRDRVAARLMAVYGRTSNVFPHVAGAAQLRHVCCFADLIYPIQALAKYARATGNQVALDIASDAAVHLCSLQGEAGQWWWHYDYRTGDVIERYPVYAIHQDAMGPMGLLALRDAGGADCTPAIRRGLEWLAAAPELLGASLIDADADLIWRKVARREPRKAVRYLQATASRVHPGLRVPGVDVVFPATAIDYEDRPYHLGWLLYAWRGGELGAPRMGVVR
jgi:hypothetical protein